jgi:beta-mannosidase
MQTVSLNGQWRMCVAETNDWIPANVPGSVYQDMLAAGRMEDPFYRDNEDKALALMDNDFIYERDFTVPDSLLNCRQVVLRMEGLDTLADVYLGGVKVLYADNMHRTWEVDVKSRLAGGENNIRIHFHSPTRYIQKMFDESPEYTGSEDCMRGFVHLRKAHCMFGWDWGPRLPDCGIWRNISLLGITGGRILNVHVRQHHENGAVTLSVKPELVKADGSTLHVKAEAVAPGGKVYPMDGVGNIHIAEPMLWWPGGYGSQPLYTVYVTLSDEAGNTLDVWERRIGLRTMTMHTEKDKWGESFCHEVNGVKIFAMGADYIPEDNLLGRVTPERTRKLLQNAKEANFNAIRVWGGGHYPSDVFYDTCDELGLVVWQDFMFACGAYKLTDAFEASIRAEFRDNILRLRHHASLGLWCGNNEMEMFATQNLWVSTPTQRYEYLRMYEYILPRMVKELDPDTFYWPASPSSGGRFDDPNAENRGDVHYWDVWHGLKPFTAYRDFYFRYASEFGFQSYPHFKTLEAVTQLEERNAFSRVMEKHQRNGTANGRILMYLSQTYLYPKDFQSLIYTSQLLQADAIRYGVEHWRRNRGRCMGAIYWQLNDCWPVISWSSIDYNFRWKALHYAARRFFAPLMISCKEEGELVEMTSVNEQLMAPVKNTVQLCVANETIKEQNCTVVWSRRDAKARILEQGEQHVLVAPLSSLWLDEMEFKDMDRQGQYVSYALLQNGNTVSYGTVLLTRPKHFRFTDPKLTVRVEGGDVIVTTQAYAKSVFIDSSDGLMKLSDNWFDMDAGERRVKILEGSPEGITVRSVFDIA